MLRLNGERVPDRNIRYLSRRFVAPDSLTLGFSSGAWLQEELRAAAPDGSPHAFHIQLTDELPLGVEPSMLSPEERARLRHLDENE